RAHQRQRQRAQQRALPRTVGPGQHRPARVGAVGAGEPQVDSARTAEPADSGDRQLCDVQETLRARRGRNRYPARIGAPRRASAPPPRNRDAAASIDLPSVSKSKRQRENRDRARTEPPPLPEPLRVAVPDCHTHMDMQGGDVAAIVAKAASVGVTPLIQVGCDLPGSRWAVQAATEHDTVWAAVALHPNEAPRIVHGVAPEEATEGDPVRPAGGEAALDEALAEIDALAAHERVRAVGETGLDHYRTGAEGRAAQERSFRAHIAIAKRHGKALMIHDRDAHGDVLRVLEEEGAPERVVFHCFSGDAEMAKVCADRGYYMSFAGNVTFGTAQQSRDAAAVAPPELLL